MLLRLLEPEQTEIEIKDMLLRIAKLYSIPNFDSESSVLLAEWILGEYKHTQFEVIKRALSSPPVGKEKSWRLTPETIAEWVEITRGKMIDEAQRIESEKKAIEPYEYHKPTELANKLLSEAMATLTDKIQRKDQEIEIKPYKPKEEAVSVGIPFGTENDLKKKELHLNWIQETFNPITGKPIEGALDEREWLLSKGYFIENGEIKEL